MKSFAIHRILQRPRKDYPTLSFLYAKEVGNPGTDGEICIANAEKLPPGTIIPSEALVRCGDDRHWGERHLYILNPDFKI